MTRVTCEFCGLPFSVRVAREGASHYCCSGCALASRIPMKDGQLPVSRQLVFALAFGFGLFNQTLFAVLGSAVAAEGHVEVGSRLMLIAVGLGAFVQGGGVALVGASRQVRWTDLLAGLVSYGAACWAAWRAWHNDFASAQWILVPANLWLGAWLARGWVRRGVRGKIRNS